MKNLISKITLIEIISESLGLSTNELAFDIDVDPMTQEEELEELYDLFK